ncbi:MAG: glycosyltransferase [Thermomicrobiales bacterium]|nr:glycosyltransferase [Thermomicrobiales bacterium]
MPSSEPENRPYVLELIRRIGPETVLDVGPGQGTYGKLIRGAGIRCTIDAIEIWAPYVRQYRLDAIYDNISICDVRLWGDFDYDLVILGDVLEHLDLDDAVEVWNRISGRARNAIVSLPIVNYPQGEVLGNPFEAHKKPDWTAAEVLSTLDGIVDHREFRVTGTFFASFANRQGNQSRDRLASRAYPAGRAARSVSSVRQEQRRVSKGLPRSSSASPLVSCILPTYGRPPIYRHLVEEAIESFLRQDYPVKELIILNDCGAQTLICDAPNVRVVNVSERFATLGEKRNAAVTLSSGELIAPWDDDDISLPWRLSQSVERIGDADYYCPPNSWYMEERNLSSDVHTALTRAHSLYRRSAFDAVGGYPHVNFRVDVAIENLLGVEGRSADPPRSAARSEVSYIYRRGVSPVHISGQGVDGTYVEIGKRPVAPGRYVLQPHWRVDYERVIKSIWSGPPTSGDLRPVPNKGPDLALDLSGFLTVLSPVADRAPVPDGRNPSVPGRSPVGQNAGSAATAAPPLVSCVLPTYGRPPAHVHLVEEAIESFLRQDYPHKELIVLNDCPDQVLVCNAPGVRVVNLDQRFPSLGEKRNAGVRLARGELIAMWDDDDINLPWRLSQLVESIGNGDYQNNHFAWYADGAFIQPDLTVHSAGALSLFRRAAFEAAGGFPPISFGDDLWLEQALREGASWTQPTVPDSSDRTKAYYVYRWGVSPVHVSGINKEGTYEAIGQRPVVQGTFYLQPHWRMDYVAAVRKMAERPVTDGEEIEPVPVETTGRLRILDSTEIYPLVSCIMPTYGRFSQHRRLVEEALESFLRQDYPNKELIILNDCPGQTLTFDHPDVRIFNESSRYPNLGAKRTAATRLARGDIIAPWDDDDISLPWRLSSSVRRLGQLDYFNPQLCLFQDQGGMHGKLSGPVGNTLSVYRRAAFDRVGGYPSVTFGEDMELDAKLKQRTKTAAPLSAGVPRDVHDVSYIIRWGVSPVHISGRGEEGMYDHIGQLPIEEGTFQLQPRWTEDYSAKAQEVLESISARLAPESKVGAIRAPRNAT